MVVDVDIVISSQQIQIGDKSFLIDQVEYLDFVVNSFAGMAGPRMRWRRKSFRRSPSAPCHLSGADAPVSPKTLARADMPC